MYRIDNAFLAVWILQQTLWELQCDHLCFYMTSHVSRTSHCSIARMCVVQSRHKAVAS